MRTLLLTVNGMSCDTCVQHLTTQLSATQGVKQVEVDLLSRTARVVHDDQVCRPVDLMAAVRRAGYQVEGFTAVDNPTDSGVSA